LFQHRSFKESFRIIDILIVISSNQFNILQSSEKFSLINNIFFKILLLKLNSLMFIGSTYLYPCYRSWSLDENAKHFPWNQMFMQTVVICHVTSFLLSVVILPVYCNILYNSLIPTVQLYQMENNYIYQLDNARFNVLRQTQSK
jgi:hypothetical protein